jgi:hypothetical protein
VAMRVCLLLPFVVGLLVSCSSADGGSDVGILYPEARDGQPQEDVQDLDWGGDAGDHSGLEALEQTDGSQPQDVKPDAKEVISITCENEDQCPEGLPFCDAVALKCVQCLMDMHCGGLDQVCKAGQCVDAPCVPDAKLCSGTQLKTCNHQGTGWASHECAPLMCVDNQCQGCDPGTRRCNGLELQECDSQGNSYQFVQACQADCFDGACHACTPGKTTCDGDQVMQCGQDGESLTLVKDCDPAQTGEVCKLGTCYSLCIENIKLNTNVGCDYWAADLDQVDEGDADNSPYAVVVSNVNPTYAAKVTITRWEGGQEVAQTTDASGQPFPTDPIPPLQLRVYFLPPRNLNLTTQDSLAWHVKSAIPVIAYQFNPLENVGVFSNDASLLIPSNALGAKYAVMTWPERVGSLRGYFAVVGVGPDVATVTVKVSAPTLAGTVTATGAPIAAMVPGETRQFTLAPFEVLQVETDGAMTDLTGSTIESDKPVAVFGGTQCSNVPDTRCVNGTCPGIGGSCSGECALTCCCDHMEEQLLPLSAWGKTYVAPMFWPRNQETAFWRILASRPDTHVTLDPPAAIVPTLQANEYFEFESKADFTITADQPVLAGQFMASSFLSPKCGTCEGAVFIFPGSCSNGMGECLDDSACCEHTGDPSFVLMIPNEQFRGDYVFLVPNKYASDYVSIVAKAGIQVTLDGAVLDTGTASPAGSSGYVVYRLPIPDGVHSLTAAQPIMAYVYGYDMDVSYGYPAGASVLAINPWGQ